MECDTVDFSSQVFIHTEKPPAAIFRVSVPEDAQTWLLSNAGTHKQNIWCHTAQSNCLHGNERVVT